jgi:hypothetical protein
VPLMVMPPSNTLVLSSDPSCASPGSSQLTFRPVSLCEWLSLHLAALTETVCSAATHALSM